MPEQKLANNYLRACQGWQDVINAQATLGDKRLVGGEAMRALSRRTFFGTRNIIVQGETALYIPDRTSGMEEQVYPFMQFGKLVTRGWLGRLYYIAMGNEAFLTWPVYEPNVIGPVQDDVDVESMQSDAENSIHYLPIDKPLRRPLHFPVGLIDYAICHDK